ncbi:hypothetical protein C0J52_16436, partial [Blattella germanica]
IKLIIEHEEELLHSLRKGAALDWQKVIEEKPELQELDIVEMPGLVSGYNELSLYCKEKLANMNGFKNVPKILPSDLAFKLYDTYGLEEHVLEQLAAVEGFSVDIEGFRNLLNESKIRSKESFINKLENETLLESIDKLLSDGLSVTKDSAKYNYRVENGKYLFPYLESEVKAILVNGSLTSEVGPNVDCSIILDCTNFYHEAGGQSSDKGVLKLKNGTRFIVKEVTSKKGYLLHRGSISEDGGSFCKGDTVVLEVDGENRLGNMRNHTATHLLNAALRKFLTVTCQHSSQVTESHLVFDFSVYGETFNTQNVVSVQYCILHYRDMLISRQTACATKKKLEGRLRSVRTPENVEQVRRTVVNSPQRSTHKLVSALGITDRTVGRISWEACCGTHVLNTSDIEDFCIVNFRAAGSGAEQLSVKLQEMKLKLSSGSPVLPYLISCHLDVMEVEMQTLLNERDSPYLVHFLRSSSVMDNVPLQKATRLCPHMPVLLIAQSEGLAKGMVPKGQDPQLVFNMKGKKVPPGNMNNLIYLAVDNAIQYAEKHQPRSSSFKVKCAEE